jgi:hypothetical protein
MKLICNTNARFEQLPTVLQQYKSTDEKIIILFLLLLDLQGTTCIVTVF